MEANLKKLEVTQYSLRYAKNSTIIYCEHSKDWQTLRRNFEAEEVEHHTYAEKSTKSHAFVLKGLDGNIQLADIRDDLKHRYNISPRAIYEMKKTRDPMYLVILDSDYNIKNLNQQIKIVLNIRVTWETRKSDKPIMQCKRCQGLGHAATFCKRAFKCSRCSGPHEITQCTTDIIKCANCGECHRSNDVNCPVYVYRLRQLEPRKRFVPAPIPTTNAWQKRNATERTYEQATTTRQQQPMPVNYSRDFPAPRPTQQQQQQQHQEQTLNVNAAQVNGGQNDFMQLAATMSELNNLVNVTELLKALRRFVEMLRNCNGDKAQILQQTMTFFTTEIHSYNF